MTLTELRYLVALAQEKHFRHAAELCHVSQPTLSIAVKKLESELGVVLFERARNGVQPTPLCEQVVSKARKLLEQIAEMKDMVNAGKDPMSGPLAMGTLPTIGPYLLPQIIPLLRKIAGDMPLYLEEAETMSLAEKLRCGELDVIITTLPFSQPDIVTQELFDEPFVVLMPANHPLRRNTTITAEELRPEELLLLFPGHSFREQVLAAFPHLQPPSTQASQETPSASFQGSTLETLRHMVASGLGITILPLSAAQPSQYASGLLTTRPFSDPAPYRTLAMSWRASFPRQKAIDVLRQAVLASSPAYWNFSTWRDQTTPGILVTNSDW